MLKKPNLILAITSGLLIMLGFIIITGVSMTTSNISSGNSFKYLLHQILCGFLPGLILGTIAYFIDLKLVKKLSLLIIIIAIILMTLIFIPGLGIKEGGASRWIRVGSLSFQPSEFLKLGFIIYLAAWLSAKKKNGGFKKMFLPMIMILGIVAILLLAQPDMSTLIVIGTVALIMYLCSNAPLWQIGTMILGGLASAYVFIKIAPYRLNRILLFFNPNDELLGRGWQLKQAVIAVGSGGIIGTGLGLSIQKYKFLPEAMSDSIFAVYAEETGFIGCLILLSLYLIFAWQALRIAASIKDNFLKLLVIGIICWITVQAFINIGAIIGILPLTGIPLPFVSYGSSHLVIELIGLGLLLNVSKKAKI